MFGFGKNRNGNVAILTAMLMPVVLMFSGGAVDFFSWNNQRVKLKELADTLATRGAREFLLANATEFQIKAVINNVIDSGYAAAYGFADLSTAISVDSIEGEVSVHLTTPPTDALFLNKSALGLYLVDMGRYPSPTEGLDALEIPHDAGVINGDHKIDPPSSERLRGPVEVLFQRFPKAQVETYLAALLALDPDSWGGLAELLQPS